MRGGVDFCKTTVQTLCVRYHPGGNPGANLKSISHRYFLREAAFEWVLTTKSIYLPLGCLQGEELARKPFFLGGGGTGPLRGWTGPPHDAPGRPRNTPPIKRLYAAACRFDIKAQGVPVSSIHIYLYIIYVCICIYSIYMYKWAREPVVAAKGRARLGAVRTRLGIGLIVN